MYPILLMSNEGVLKVYSFWSSGKQKKMLYLNWGSQSRQVKYIQTLSWRNNESSTPYNSQQRQWLEIWKDWKNLHGETYASKDWNNVFTKPQKE